MTAVAAAAAAPAAASGAQPFRNQCAALRIKPNSDILAHEAELRTAEDVDLTSNYLGGCGVQALTDMLKSNARLRSLSLHANGLSNESVVFLCRALRHHPTLKRLDLSGNPISLPAGLALLQYVHATTTVEEINLEGTLIDELLVKKINRSININRSASSRKPAPAVQATLSSIRAEFVEKRQVREKAKVIRADVAEQLSGSTMRDFASKATLPPRDPESGWLVINLYASTTPGDFFSELELLNREVIPRLNDAFKARKTHFVLSSLYHGLTPKQRAAMPKTCYADVQAALNKAPTVFLQFLGDKVGEFADGAGADEAVAGAASDAAASGAAAGADQGSVPLQQFEREHTPAAQRGMCLYLVRQNAKLLQLPAALLPLFSDDPQSAFPDSTTSIVKHALLEARGVTPPAAHDPRMVHARYQQLCRAKAEISERGATYASVQYGAEFDSVDEDGNVRLRKLEPLCAGIIKRVTAFTDLLLSRSVDASGSGSGGATATPSIAAIKKALCARANVLPGRKSLTGKLDLYCVTPPSRNALLLAHEPGAGATTLLAALNARLDKRPGFITVSHFAREPVFGTTMSRDAKTMFVSLTQQVLAAYHASVAESKRIAAETEASNGGAAPSAAALGMTARAHSIPTSIKPSIADDLDVFSAKQLFTTVLTDVAAELLAKSIVVVVLVDGLDSLEHTEMPCEALRRHEATGADEWPSTDPDEMRKSALVRAAEQREADKDNKDKTAEAGNNAAGASAAAAAAIRTSYDELDWVPTCLAKNVRFVLSCHAQSRAHQQLELRGHDSCDVVVVPDLGDADFEAIMGKLCDINAVEPMTEVELAAVRARGQFRSPQYLQFVMETVVAAKLSPQYMKRTTALLSAVPDNLNRCCDALLDRFEAEFGLPVAQLVSTALCCCARTGGMLDVHLRELVQRLRVSRGDIPLADRKKNTNSSTSTSVLPLLNSNELERMLRLLRPVLDQSSALAAALCPQLGPLSATYNIVHVRSTHFVDCVRRRYLPTVDAAAAAHKHVAHFYLRHCEHGDPFQQHAVRAAAAHIVESGLWDTLEERLLSLPFLAMVMRHRQAAPVFNTLVRAYNTLQPALAAHAAAMAHAAANPEQASKVGSVVTQTVVAGTAAAAPAAGGFKPRPPQSGGAAGAAGKASGRNNAHSSGAANEAAATAAALPINAANPLSPQQQQHQLHVALLQLLREYIYFIRRNFRTLAAVPHLVAQLAVLLPVDSALHIAAGDLLSKRRVPHLLPVRGRTRNSNLHHALITGCQFTPSGLRIATGSHDGTVKVSNVMGEVVHTIRDGAAKVLFIKYSMTSRYLVAACENHVILVIDAASGQTVSKIQGHSGQIRCLTMTARGRNVLAGYEDRELWVWDSETGRHIATVGHHTVAPVSSPFGAVSGVIPHPTDERIVYTVCERRLLGSRILHAPVEGGAQQDAASKKAAAAALVAAATSTDGSAASASAAPQQFQSLLNIVGHNALPLAAESCHVVCDGTFALLCAKDLTLQPPSFVRSEVNVKVFSLHTGRFIAGLALESSAPGNRPGPVACAVSPDERCIVTGALDGAMRVYHPDWRTYSTIEDAGLPEPTTVRPVRVLAGFSDAAPTLLKFSFDSKCFLAAAGGVARIWPVKEDDPTQAMGESFAAAQADGMMAGFDPKAKIEFAVSGANITCADLSPNPSDDGAQIVIGDDRGKLYCLREQ